MKFTLTLTKTELLQLLSKATNTTITDYILTGKSVVNPLQVVADKTPEVMIDQDDYQSGLAKDIVNSMQKEFGIYAYINNNSGFGPASRKIDAIRYLREMDYTTKTIDNNKQKMRLVDSTWAIENWVEWIGYINVYCEIPYIIFNDNNEYVIDYRAIPVY